MILAKSTRKRMSGFSRILYNRRLKSILMILIRKSCMINNVSNRKCLLKILKMRRKRIKKEIHIKMFNIRFRKKNNKKESYKCRNIKKTKKLKKPLLKMTNI